MMMMMDDGVLRSFDKSAILKEALRRLQESLQVISYVRQSLSIQNAIHFTGLWWCLVAISLLSVAYSTFVEVPKNTIVLKWKSSEAIEMACKSDCQCNLQWYARKNRDSEKEELFNGYFLHPDAKSYCTVIMDEPGKCYLNLTNTEEAAQTYICFEPGSLLEASADLIWLGDLNCSDSSTEDLVNLTCSVEFRGNWAPTMKWKEHSSNGERVRSVGVKTYTVPNQCVTSTLVMAMQDGSRNYTCATKFEVSGKPNYITATNIPEYTYSKIVRQQDKPDTPNKGLAIRYTLILGLPLFVILSVTISQIFIVLKNKV